VQQHRRRLTLEPLEDRRVLSVFYDLQEISRPTAASGEALTGVEMDVSVNSSGQVAFVGKLNSADEGVLVGNGIGEPALQSLLVSGSGVNFASPQIVHQGNIVVRSELGSISSVDGLDPTAPAVPEVFGAEGLPANPGTFTDVKLGLRAEDGNVAFVGQSDAAAAPGLYFSTGLLTQPENAALLHDPLARPMVANGKTAVFRQDNNGAKEIVVVRPSGNAFVTEVLASTNAAEPAKLFTHLGAAPGISDDGSIVVFSGDRGNGPGVFALVNQGSGFGSIIRVAGESTIDYYPNDPNNVPDPNNELGHDDAGNAIYLSQIDLQRRLGVARMGLNGASFDNESFVVTFVGQPSAASVDNPAIPGNATPLLFSDKVGIWSVRVDIQRELHGMFQVFHPTSPIPVVQWGDKLDGRTVTDFELYDPVATALKTPLGTTRSVQSGDHYVAFWAQLHPDAGAPVSKVFRADHLDTDADGLLDHWERPGGGIDIDRDGTVDLDLNALGADPLHKDVFLEIDWLADQATHRHEPAPSVTAQLVAMFAAAPLANPDGTTGVRLHVDAGPGNDAAGLPFSQQLGSATPRGGDSIGMPGDPSGHVDVVNFSTTAAAVPGVNARSFQSVKSEAFGNHDKWARELAFHYAVFAEAYEYYPSDASPQTGTVASLSPDGSTLTANGIPFFDYTDSDLHGMTLLITSGPAKGALNTIDGRISEDTLSLLRPWTATPGPSDHFVLLHGSSGIAESDSFPSNDNHALPGNDLAVTLGAFRKTTLTPASGPAYSIFGSAYTQWRTLAHELGHTLALNHCGITPSESYCQATPFDYLSLMSYAHQLVPQVTGSVANATANTLTVSDPAFSGKNFKDYTVKITSGTGVGQVRKVLSSTDNTLTLTAAWQTPPDTTSVFVLSTGVDGYSGPSDPLFYDWGHLRPDFANVFMYLGNTRNTGLHSAGAGIGAELTLADYLGLYGAEPDATAPTVAIYDAPGGSPLGDGEEISKGRDLTVYVSAADDVGVAAVWALFDADGDGTLEADEMVLAEWDAESGLYVAAVEDISGEVGTRTLDAIVYDTFGNFAIDSVDVEVTHDYSFLAELFEQIGQALQEAIPEIPVTVSVPFLEDGLADVMDLYGTFAGIADRMYDDVIVTGAAVGSPVIAADQTLLVTIDGGQPLAVTLAAGSTATNATIADLVADLNAVLLAEGLDGDLLFASINDGSNDYLTLEAIGDFVRSMTVTTLQLPADAAVPVAYGQLSGDAKIDLTVTRLDDGQALTNETQVYTLHVAQHADPNDENLPYTDDNALPEDLVDDVNAALVNAGVDGVYALLDSAGRIVFGATDVNIDQLAAADSIVGSLAALGFTATFNATAAVTPLGFKYQQAIAELRYDSLEDFATVLTDVLNNYTDNALPSGFDVDVQYDAPSDTVTFNFALNKSYSKTVDLNLVDEGIDLGLLGTLDVAALADAAFSVDAGLNFRLGVYLGDLGAGFAIDGSTPLSQLNGGAGVDVLVGMTADNAAASNGQLGSNATFTLTIEREDGSDDSLHTLTLYELPSNSNPARPASNDNANVAALVSDLNVLFAQVDLGGGLHLDDVVQAGVYTFEDSSGNVTEERVMLRAVQTPDAGLSPIRSLTISGGEAFGFGTNQSGNFADLDITVLGDSNDQYLVDLDGAITVQDVIDAIQTQTGGDVAMTLNADATGLTLTANGLITVASAFTVTDFTDNGNDADNEGFSSLASAGLGLLANDEANVVNGQPLHGADLADRVFIVENPGGDPNFTFAANVVAELDASAALGCLGLSLTTNTPLWFEITADAHLADPNANDSRIYLSEVFDDPGAVVDMSSATLGAAAGGLVEVTLGSTELNPPISSDPDLLEQVSGQTDPLITLSVTGNTVTGFDFTADTNFEDIVSQFKNVCLDDILNLLSNVADEIQGSNLPILNVEIPLLDKSLGDLIDFGDGLVDAASRFLSEVDLSAAENALDDLDSAISNLSLSLEDRGRLFRMGTLLRGLTSDPASLDSKLLSGLIQLAKIINADVPGGTGGKAALEDAFAALADLLPSWNTLADRLEQVLEDALVELGFSAGDIGVALGFADYDGNAGTEDNALVVGVTISHTVSETFAPQLPVTAEFGPLAFDVDPSLIVAAGGTLALGFGITLDSSATPFVIVDPPAHPDLIQTSLNLNAGFDGAVTGDISLGSLDLVEADATLILANAVHETLTVSGGAVTLAAAPLNADERFVIVTAGGSLVPTENLTLSGTTLALASVSNGTVVDVEYQTLATPGADPDPLGDAGDRAQLDINFVPGAPILSNALGAVPFASWFTNTNVAATGMVTGALDVSFLGNTVEDAVTLAVGMNNLADPRLEVDADALGGLFTNLDFDLKTIIVGLEKLLELLETGLTNEVVTQIPVIGDGFEAAGTFIGKLEGFVEDFRIALDTYSGDTSTVQGLVQSFIFNELGPAGLNILGDTDASGSITIADVEVELDTEHFQIFFRLEGQDKVSLDFDLGLDGLPITAEGQGGLEFGWDYQVDFGIGVDREQGVYLIADASNPEITFSLDAGLTVQSSGGEYVPTGFTIDLFGLELSATDNVNQSTGNPGTHVGGSLELDLTPTSGDRLPLGDLASANFSELFDVDLNAAATVDLILEAGLGSNLPSIQTELVLGCTASASLGGEVSASCSSIELKNTGINLGDFLSQHLGSLINKITQYLEPIEPVIQLLKTEVPGVSQLSEAAGNGPVTMLDLAFMDEPDIAEVARKFVDALDTILQIADSLETMDNGSVVFKLMDDLSLPAGGVDGGDWASGVDVDSAVSGSGGQTNDAEESTGTIKSLLQAVEALGINLHFLEIGNIVRMLLGQPFDVISYELPYFSLPFGFSQKFPVWTPPPISVEVGLHAEVFADLSVGYDSHGLDTGNFFDGFYFGDRENVFTGDDIDEFGLGVGVTLAALLDLVVASAGVEGEIRADIFANWRDLDNDGKMHLDELVQIVNTDGIGCVFDLRGELRALVSLVWEVFGAEGSHTFIDVLLFSFKNECPTFELGHVAGAGESLPNGTTTAADTLVLHAGAFAGKRGPGSSSDVAEAFTVTQVASGVYDVEALGLQSRYAGVTSIFFDGGAGDDALYLVDVTVPVTAYGGAGNDTLEGGSAIDYLDGGAGHDTLYGFAGGDTLVGGGGNDTIDGDAGNDTIDGGAGDDLIDGGADNDTIDGGSGNDIIHGRAGTDWIGGGSGNDQIFGGADDDTIDGGPGADLILGEAGLDAIHGGSGGDLISGGSGGDFLYGDSGNDLIVGGQLDANEDLETLLFNSLGIVVDSLDKDVDAAADAGDELWGGLDNDFLIGDEGLDKLYGGWGNDLILAHLLLDRSTTFAEYIEGGPDNDFVCGGSGQDEIYGGTHSAVALAHVLAEEGGPTFGGATTVSCDALPTIEMTETGTLEGTLFFDVDASGVFDSGEAGLASWTVNLFDSDGDLVDSALTAGDGTYSFSGVEYGSYTVTEVLGAGYVQTAPASLTHAVTLAAGATLSGLDFGNDFLGATIRGQKFHDEDGNRIKDPGEGGLNGWQIELRDTSGELVASTMTADRDLNNDNVIDVTTERGLYFFADLVPGSYWVTEVARSGWIPSTPPLSSANTFQFIADDGFSPTRSDAKVTGLTGAVTDVNVTLNVAHETLEQLKIFLLSPEGTKVVLVDGVGGDAANFTNTILDDEAFWQIGAAPQMDGYSSDFAPLQSLSKLDGEDPNGVWTLVIQDKTEETVGRLNGWSVTIATSGGDNLTFNGGSLNVFESDRLVNYEVTVATGDTATRSFGNFQPGRVRGTKFEDLNGDGQRDAGEGGLAGVTIYADLNNNGQLDRLEPSTVTEPNDPSTPMLNETGMYTLSPLPPGSYVIREVLPSRAVQTVPLPPPGSSLPGGYSIQITSGDTLKGRDFGNQPRGEIHGTKWIDTNGNGFRDPGEPGLADVVIYSDRNGNGQLDANERATVTMADDPATKSIDETGHYWLLDLPVGTHTLREVVPPGYAQTAGGSVLVYADDFEGPAVGPGWSTQELSATPKFANHYLGSFGNEEVNLDLTGLPAHGEITVEFDLYVLGAWDGNGYLPSESADVWQLAIDGQPQLVTTFSNVTGFEQAYPDTWGDAANPAQTDARAIDSLGYDLPHAVYRIQYRIAHQSSDLRLVFSAAGLSSDKLDQERWGLDNLRIAIPQNHHLVALESYEVVEGIDFGNRPRGGGVDGEKYEDRNGNHRRDPDEPGLAGVTIYADLNDNGQLDDNEPSTVTLADDPQTTHVDETGHYRLQGLLPGQYVIREVVPEGYAQTTSGREVLYENDFETPAGSSNPVGDEWSTDQVTTSPNGQRTFLGLFANELVSLSLTGLPAHNTLQISFDLIVAGAWDGNHPRQGPDRWSVGLHGQTPLLDTTFSNVGNGQPTWQNPVDPFDVNADGFVVALDVLLPINRINLSNQGPLPVPPAPTPGQFTFYDVTGDAALTAGDVLAVVNLINSTHPGVIPGTGRPLGAGQGEFYAQAFPGVDGMGDHPPRTGAAEMDSLGYDSFGIPPTDVRYRPSDAVYHLTFTVPHSGDSVVFDFQALGLSNHDLDFEKWGLDNVVVAVPNTGYTVDVGPDQVVHQIDFGNRPTKQPADFGDSPDQPYPTLLARNGARHTIVPEYYLGSRIDADPDGQPTADAAGDDGEEYDDDDGVRVLTQLVAGKDVRLEVIASARGFLNAWVDFNGDGDWQDEGEHFLVDRLVAAGVNSVSAPVPASPLPNVLHARFRFSTQQGLSFTGPAPDGEVEDYRFGPGQTPGGSGEAEDPAVSGLIIGAVWSDSNGNGVREAADIGLAGVTVYADLNRNGTFDGGEPSAVTQPDNADTPEDERGVYNLRGTFDGPILVRQVVPAGYLQTYPTGPGGFHTVLPVQGEPVERIDFGNRLERQGQGDNEVRGRKWLDTNGDGQQQENEPGLAGVTIYVDLNQNGLLDGGEPNAVTADDVPETSADETGQYVLTGVPSGEITVREIVPNGYEPTTPSGGAITFFLEDGLPGTSGDPVTVHFGNRPVGKGRNIVTGTKWHDQTGELGWRDPGDPGLAGVTIYVDLNGNAHLDAGEPSAVSQTDNPATPQDETGQYRIESVPDGQYQVREVEPVGWKQSYPAAPYTVTLASGTVAEGLDFGNFQYTPLQDGDDIIYAGDGDDLVYGDNLVADPFVISVGTRRDTLYGEAGQDLLYGQERDDQLSGGADDDQLDGGENIDRVLQTSDLTQILADDVAPNSATLTSGPSTDNLLNIEHATLTGEGGDNLIDASGFSYGSVILQGGSGADTLIGTAFDDVLEGGDGDDTLQAGAGNDRLEGGDGSDLLEGGDGGDRYVFESATTPEADTVTETATADEDILDFLLLPAGDPVHVDLFATLTGTTNNRALTFTNPQFLENVFGGEGNDILIGSVADNRIVGGPGDDAIQGMDGDDVLAGGDGSDTLDGGNGNDTFVFDDSWGTLDLVFDPSGDDSLNLSRIGANLTVSLLAVGDLLVTDGTSTLRHVGNTIEHVLGGQGHDRYKFEDGAMLAGGLGDINDPDGLDLLDYSAYTTPVSVHLLLGTATGTAGVAGIEHVFGGSHNDVLTGDNGLNALSGNAGDDQLSGLGGNDVLFGGAGNDVLLGNTGDDVYLFTPAVGFETDLVNEQSGEGADTLDFGTFDLPIVADLTSDAIVTSATRTVSLAVSGNWLHFEKVVGTDFDDVLTPNGNNNLLTGGDGHDVYRVLPTVTGIATFVEETTSSTNPALGGTDRVDFSAFATGVTFDMSQSNNVLASGLTLRLRDGAGGNAPLNFEDLLGGSGDDVLTGNDAANILGGGAGNDTLHGLRGNDTLLGGAGTNHLYGGVGDDTYIFVDPSAAVTTTLHEDAGQVGGGQVSPGGTDTLDLSALTTSVTFDLSMATNTNGLLTVHLQDGAGAAAAAHFEILIGSATQANVLAGNDADNLLVGGSAGDQLTGAGGHDTLVGGSGGDTLYGDGAGTPGRDLLFGGSGADTLHGGGEDDLLSSGGFDYTSPLDRPALDAIRLAWRSQISYADRIATLQTGAGPSNQYKLTAATYQPDLSVDTLFGQADEDWFLVDDASEVSDLALGELVDDLT
jgi:Ca2+-binding RTX toxin-like protein/subtilisin-like proprotein convertase family protein